MKKLFLWSLTAFTFIGLQAQECENFAYLKQGAKMETTTYNKKDKLQSVSNIMQQRVG